MLTAMAIAVFLSPVGDLTAGKRLDIVVAREFFSGNWNEGVRSCSGSAKMIRRFNVNLRNVWTRSTFDVKIEFCLFFIFWRLLCYYDLEWDTV